MDKTLLERWKSDAKWKRRWEDIVKWIFSQEKNMNIEEMDYTADGYLDLRGFPFYNGIDFTEYTDIKYEDIIQDSRGLISNKRFEKVDFSFSDFSIRYIYRCEFNECIFDNTTMRDITEEQCLISNCIFKKGIYGGFLGLGESHYKNVQFQNVKMFRTQMWWPDFEDCLFQNCNLKGTDFGGAHFKNVKFAGKVDNVWFRGKMPDHYKENCRWRPEIDERWDQVFPMEADFSEAALSNLTISDGCDLSEVILPSDGSCYLILNFEGMRDGIDKRIKKVKRELLEEILKYHLIEVWERREQKMGLLCLNDVYSDIKESIKAEEQQESYAICKEVCNDLLSQGILTLGK